MPKPSYATCKDCGAHRDNVGMLSHSRLCGPCAEIRVLANIDGIHERRGAAHERRIYGVVREALGPRLALALKQAGAFGDSLPDDG